jgi:RNA polymerase sigma-70 factor (ECF subfamily)
MPDPSGPGLILLAQRGDVDAIGALYDQHHLALFRYIWLRVGERTLAEDLTGDVFVRMLAALPRYRPSPVSFRAWLYRIARNRVIDHYRKEGDRHSTPLEQAEAQKADDQAPLTLFERKLTLERLRRALESLDQTQREVVTLRFLSGLSLQETAGVMGKTEAAIKALQHRGLATLRSTLSEESGDHEMLPPDSVTDFTP